VIDDAACGGDDYGLSGEAPSREDAEQGALGDAGLIAVLGAVAGHLPGEIINRVIGRPDGSYLVRLAEAWYTNTGAVPTGRTIELSLTPDLPVYDSSPGEPAYAKAETAAWAAIAEKALAGVDQAWTARRRAQWQDTWARLCADDPRKANSREAPSGYVRLNQDSTAFDYAEALTQLTGRQAVVRELPAGRGRRRRALRRQIRTGKPVIVSTRPATFRGEIMPCRLISTHCYEVIAVRWRTIGLRNPWGYYHPAPVPLSRLAAVLQPRYATLA